MEIQVAGLNHKTAPVEKREKLSLTREGLGTALPRLRRQAQEGAILSTCNRTEFYTLCADGPPAADAGAWLEALYPQAAQEIGPHLYHYRGREAVTHLFRVASGLDSMILGEPQVLGQVRAAYQAAIEAGAAGPVLSHLFRQAVRVGRRARTESRIGRNAASVSYAAVELTRQALGRRPFSVLLIGAGKMGELTAKTLVENGAGDIAIASRTNERAQELARRFVGRAVPMSRLGEALRVADVAISSTDSPHHIIRRPLVQEAVRQRQERPLLLIDIAVPRDIEPAVRGVEGVRLYDIDDLGAVVRSNLRERQREATKVEAIVEQEASAFMEWWRCREVVPVIAALYSRGEALRRRELERALHRLPNLGPQERETLDALTRALVKKLLHPPVSRLRANGHQDLVPLTKEFFALETV